ncbi:A-kinase anchor protein 7-like [Saccostrea cucullata]|uniref:A-kinase anchor protein 7-like n=1 Tax=Saccostrea cuccullata TaxID=36930 RepID=UPI002ED68DA7
MEEKRRPNHFLAIQVTDKKIKQNVRELQNVILEKEKHLSHAMVKTERLHLTLGVYHLEDQERVAQAAEALDRFHSKLNISDFTPPSLNVSMVGHFNHQVLFASVTEDEGLDVFNNLVNYVKKSLETLTGIRRIEPTHYEEKKTTYFGKQTAESIQLCSMTKPMTESGYYHTDGFVATDDRYTPHITIGKMSTKLRKLGIRRIEPTHYEEKKTTYFGKQTAESIQLCSMTKPMTESGYYHVEHEIRFLVSDDSEDQ